MNPDAAPLLAPHVRRQVDRLTGAALLLHPEGAVELSETADAIVQLCDGTRSVDAIATALAEEYDVPPGGLRADIDACVEALLARGLLRA